MDAGRLFHARTALPVTKEDLEASYDSDDSVDEEHWTRKSRAQLEEIDDITASEKDFMFRWNEFVRRNAVFADALLPDALALFALQERAELAASAPLRRCFTLHMVTLWEYGLLGAPDVDRALRLIGARIPPHEAVSRSRLSACCAWRASRLLGSEACVSPCAVGCRPCADDPAVASALENGEGPPPGRGRAGKRGTAGEKGGGGGRSGAGAGANGAAAAAAAGAAPPVGGSGGQSPLGAAAPS